MCKTIIIINFYVLANTNIIDTVLFCSDPLTKVLSSEKKNVGEEGGAGHFVSPAPLQP